MNKDTEMRRSVQKFHRGDDSLRNEMNSYVVALNTLPASRVLAQPVRETQSRTVHNMMDEYTISGRNIPERTSVNTIDFLNVLNALAVSIIYKDNPNLPTGFERLERRAKVFTTTGELSLVTFDMDHLSYNNYRYSHLHGSLICGKFERILEEAADQFNGICAAMGEENLLALPYNLEDTHVIATSIADTLSQTPFNFGAEDFHQGVTAGISSLSHVRPQSLYRLIELSGAALVHGKKNGRGVATIFADKK
jgi:GGDEF domain-containing protein